MESEVRKKKKRADREAVEATMDATLSRFRPSTCETVQKYPTRAVASKRPGLGRAANPDRRDDLFVTPTLRPFSSAMDVAGVDCLIHAVYSGLSTFVGSLDVVSLRAYVLRTCKRDVTDCGFTTAEIRGYFKDRLNGHVHLVDMRSISTLTEFAGAVTKSDVRGVFLCRVTVKYEVEVEHFVSVMVDETHAIVRDALQPGDHPFRLGYMREQLRIISLSKVYKMLVYEESPLL